MQLVKSSSLSLCLDRLVIHIYPVFRESVTTVSPLATSLATFPQRTILCSSGKHFKPILWFNDTNLHFCRTCFFPQHGFPSKPWHVDLAPLLGKPSLSSKIWNKFRSPRGGPVWTEPLFCNQTKKVQNSELGPDPDQNARMTRKRSGFWSI